MQRKIDDSGRKIVKFCSGTATLSATILDRFRLDSKHDILLLEFE